MATTSDMAPTRRKSGNDRSAAKAETREQQLESQVVQLQQDLKAISETLSKLTGEKVGEARSLATSEVQHLRERGQQMLSQAQDQMGETEKQLKDTIRDKPLTAVVAAAGIGFLFALLTRH
jgi:ElaB/YqjD/DUF883 family membrane-anchored ribosome-binding protein